MYELTPTPGRLSFSRTAKHLEKKKKIPYSNSFLTCAETVVRSGSCAVRRVVAGADCFSKGAVGHGQTAIETFPSDSGVSVPPGPSSPWQHTQTLALQKAQNWWALQRGQLASNKHWNWNIDMWIRHQVILFDLLQQCQLGPAVLGCFAQQLPDTGTWQ